MVGLFIDFLTSGLSLLEKLLGAYFMVFGRASFLNFYLVGKLGHFKDICTLGQMIMVQFFFRLICYFWLGDF